MVKERLEQWVLYAVRDCARRMAQPLSLVDARRTALIVIGPDKSRAHADASHYLEVVLDAMKKVFAGEGDTPDERRSLQ